METQDPQFYALLLSRLNPEQTKGLQGVMVIAEQKRAQYASQAIERQGGKQSIFTISHSRVEDTTRASGFSLSAFL